MRSESRHFVIGRFADHVRDDSGVAAVIVAIFMVAAVGFAALAVDVGYLYDTRHKLQALADAGALAGCDVLIETDGDIGQAEAMAAQYVADNADDADAALANGYFIGDITADTSAHPWSVYVQVQRAVPAWFSRIFGSESQTIRANAKAEATPLTGARYLLPWAIPIILDDDIDHVTAEVVSGGTVVSGPVTLSSAGARQFAGTLSAPSGAGGYDVRVAVHNIYGIVEYVGDSKGPQPASRMMVDDATYPFSSITLSGDYFSSDAPVDYTLNVTTKATQPKVSVEIDGHKHSMDPVGSTGTQWSLTLSSGDLDDGDGFLETANVDLYLGNKADNLVDTYLHVRRSTYPFFDVYLDNTIVAPSSSVDVHVDLNEFDPAVPGQIFTLRVGSTGVETGNFGEINFKQIEHNTDYSLAPCPANPVGVSLGNNVKDWVADGYGGGVHIGDIIPLSPGNSGWTDRVIEDHILEHGDIVCTPVVTKFEQKSGGSYAVIVRKFAAFRIVSYDTQGTKGHIVAEFLEYVMTPDSFGSGSGGGTGTAYAARLVNP